VPGKFVAPMRFRLAVIKPTVTACPLRKFQKTAAEVGETRRRHGQPAGIRGHSQSGIISDYTAETRVGFQRRTRW